jgi:hypothetical protein
MHVVEYLRQAFLGEAVVIDQSNFKRIEGSFRQSGWLRAKANL